MRVYIPTPLRSYTYKASVVEGNGSTLAEVLDDLDRRFPGIRFRVIDEQERVRAHFVFFVNQSVAGLSTPLDPHDQVRIVAAISGG